MSFIKTVRELDFRKITALAPLVLAISALFSNYFVCQSVQKQVESLKYQRNNLRLMSISDSLQWETYINTMRPYVFVDSVLLAPANPPNQNKFIFQYRVKNIGKVPAKDIISSFTYSEKKEKIFIIERNIPKSIELFPDESTEIIPPNTEPATFEDNINKLLKEPYIHIHVRYMSMNGKEYNYRTVKRYDNKLKKLINEFTDFD